MAESDQTHAAKILKAAFGHTNLYQILEIDGDTKNVGQPQIKKAYMKLALKHHPDKGGDKSIFQALSTTYAILSDEEKRKIYDETGTLDDEDDGLKGDFDFWYKYFRDLFPQVTVNDIKRFETQYIGTEEEKNDVIKEYEKHEGDLKKIMSCVMFAEVGEEARICKIIDEAIAEKLLKSLPKYRKSVKALSTSTSSTRKNKRSRNDSEDEEDIDCEQDDGEDEEIEEGNDDIDVKDTKKKRKPVQKEKKVPKKRVGKKKEDDLGDLEAMMKQRAANRASTFNSIFQNYSKEELEDDIPDDEFEKTQKRIFKGNSEKSNTKRGKK